MPAAAAHTLFGRSDLTVNARLLSILAFLASSEKPVETPTVVGDYALSEMCVSDSETADIKKHLNTLRSEAQQDFVSQTVQELRAQAAQSRNHAVAAAANAVESEFARFLKVFFLRVRSYQVIQISTDEPIGRVVCFPDQISDDYGNNLEERTETGIIQSIVDRSHGAEKLPTVYVGHGQGAAMAEFCSCAAGGQAIIFDANLLSTLLVYNAVTHKCVQPEPDDGDVPRDFNLIDYRTEAAAAKQDAVVKSVQKAVEEIAAEEKAAEEKAAEAGKKGEVKKEDKNDIHRKKEEEHKKTAAEWFESREWFKIGGIVSAAASSRFEKTGRYNAKALSDMLVDYTASIRACPNPYKQ